MSSKDPTISRGSSGVFWSGGGADLKVMRGFVHKIRSIRDAETRSGPGTQPTFSVKAIAETAASGMARP